MLRTTPKDFFLHLGATIVLYVGTGALIHLAFSVINYWFPDALAGNFSVNTIAWPISMLLVLIPTLYILEWIIRKDININPEKQELWIRRWRIYLTLFLTAIIIIGDFIALINTYLNGEISVRFFYKFISIFVICGIIFTYYLLQKPVDTPKLRKSRLALGGVGIVLVLFVIIGGFSVVGSPAKQRALKFDAQRVNDLVTIQWQIITFWQQKGRIPANLDELKDPLSYAHIPKDPETGNEYEYSSDGVQTFNLCAVFSEVTQDTKGRGEFGYGRGGTSMIYPAPGGLMDENWTHEKGRTCFERKIDPDRFPVNVPPKPLR